MTQALVAHVVGIDPTIVVGDIKPIVFYSSLKNEQSGLNDGYINNQYLDL